MKKMWICLIVFLALIAATDARAAELTIIYSGAEHGELEPCGCSPKSDYGGLARRSAYIAPLIKDAYLLVEAGNFTDADTPQGRLKAATMLETLAYMGYDAIGLMERELAYPDEFMAPLTSGLPVLSGATGGSIKIERAGIKVNVSTDPERRVDGAVNVLLTGVSLEAAREFMGWDVIVLSSGETLEEPVLSGRTVIVSGYPQGERVGVLRVDDAKGFVSHTWGLLDNTITEDPAVRAMLTRYDKAVAALPAEQYVPPPEATYMGAAECVRCHRAYHAQWHETRHASAFESLERVGKSADPECVKCHVVGYRQDGGFFNIKDTPGLADVQCEACHGPARAHLDDYYAPMPEVGETVCRGCHTSSNSPEFNYDLYRSKIEH